VGNSDAIFDVIVTDGGVTSVYVLFGGSGYAVNDVITIVHPSGTSASVIVATVNGSGSILSTQVLAGGSGYEPVEATAVITHPSGAGFTGTVLTNSGVVTGVSISSGGFGYQDLEPTLDISTTSGSGAEFSFTISAGVITAINVVDGGSGYSQSDTVTVIPASGDDGSDALATLTVTTVANAVNTLLYYNVWSGTTDDRLVSAQLDFIINYFKCLGYTFEVETNPTTGNTIQWHIYW
jgi:hypothetical protein